MLLGVSEFGGVLVRGLVGLVGCAGWLFPGRSVLLLVVVGRGVSRKILFAAGCGCNEEKFFLHPKKLGRPRFASLKNQCYFNRFFPKRVNIALFYFPTT